MLPSMDGLARQLASCSFVPPTRILLPEGKKLDIYMEAAAGSSSPPLEGVGFLRTVPAQDELTVQVQ